MYTNDIFFTRRKTKRSISSDAGPRINTLFRKKFTTRVRRYVHSYGSVPLCDRVRWLTFHHFVLNAFNYSGRLEFKSNRVDSKNWLDTAKTCHNPMLASKRITFASYKHIRLPNRLPLLWCYSRKIILVKTLIDKSIGRSIPVLFPQFLRQFYRGKERESDTIENYRSYIEKTR